MVMQLFFIFLLGLASASWFSSETFQRAEVLNSWATHRISKRASDVSEADYSRALDRINQESKVLDQRINSAADVDLYIISAGVSSTHSEVGERYSQGWSFDGTSGDCDGTGTAAASVAIGETLGIARDANVVPVKVHCNSAIKGSDLRKGVEFITKRMEGSRSRAVVLVAMEVYSDMVNELKALAERTLVIIPVGDDGSDVCSRYNSLKASGGILIVGGSTKEDRVATSSNYGSCVDIFAPGQDVTVAVSTDNTQTTTMSSTIYAAAAVAGVNAVQQGDVVEVDTLELQKAMILSKSTKGAMKFESYQESSNNRLLFFICSSYKIPDDPKCYIAQSDELDCTSIKSVHTFDGSSYEYHEHCADFTLFASTASDVIITVSHQVQRDRGGRRDLMPIYTINTGSNIIELAPGPDVSVDGVELNVENIGNIYRQNDINITHEVVVPRGSIPKEVPVITVVLVNDNITVTYDGTNELRVEITDSQKYYEKTSGLCGFYDRSVVIEFMDKDLKEMQHINMKESTFVDEWKTKTNDCPECNMDTCIKTDCHPIAEKACSAIKDPSGIFTKCHEMVPPHEWYERCVEAVKECCCLAGDTEASIKKVEQCKCTEENKYWTAAMFDNCVLTKPCDKTCEKEDTHELCIDNAGKKTDFFYREKIRNDPKDECHYVTEESGGSKGIYSETKCKADGSWSDEPAVCNVKKCEMPVAKINTILKDNLDSYECPVKVNFKCDKTVCDCNCYQMDSNDQIECTSAGDRIAAWSAEPPTCSLKQCEQPVVPKIDIVITLEAGGALSWIEEVKMKDTVDTSCCAGKITYGCHECYKLNAAKEAQCCAKTALGWGDVPTCELQQCVDPQKEIDAGDDPHLVVKTKDFYCGTVAEYSCDSTCYEIVGKKTRKCGGWKSSGWEHELPKCVKKECPPLPGFDDGKYIYHQSEIQPLCGDNVTVQCDSCYYPCADTCDRQCVSDGMTSWTNGDPTCAIRKCPPRNIKNAIVQSGVSECGESVTAECERCYKKISGEFTRKCDVSAESDNTCPPTHTDGEWSGEELVCQLQECPKLDLSLSPNLEEVRSSCQHDYSNITCGCTKTFKCPDCYNMSGSATITCEGLVWSDDLPKCELKTCDVPDVGYSREFVPYPKNGCFFLRDGVEIFKETKLECGNKLTVEAKWAECYHVCNNDVLECKANEGNGAGFWNIPKNQYPLCKMVKCDKPEDGTNTESLVWDEDNDDDLCNKTIEYTCKPCHELVSGSLQRTCKAVNVTAGAEGEWSGGAPVCQKIKCEVPEDLIDGSVIYDAATCGQTIEFECKECKRMIGDKTGVCEQTDGYFAEWTIKPPKCEPICCPTLSSIHSTDPTYDVTAMELIYVHKDPITMHFTKDEMSVKTYYDNCAMDHVCQEMEAKCDVCYEYYSGVANPPNRVCVKEDNGLTGYWTNTEKVCKRKTCALRPISNSHNAHYEQDGMAQMNNCSNEVKIKCNKCHRLPSSALPAQTPSDMLMMSLTQTCGTDKQWSEALPKCERVMCEVPNDPIENGRVSKTTPTECGEEIEYTCDVCYRLVGARTLTCGTEADGYTAVWSNKPPRCEPICCEPLNHLTNDDYKLTPSTLLSYVNPDIDITINVTQIYDDEWYATCKKNYVCQKVDAECGKCFEYTQDDYVMNKGVAAPPARTCIKNDVDDVFKKSSWTNKEKACTVKKCAYRDLIALIDHHIHYLTPVEVDTETICEDKVGMECNDCYELLDGSVSVEQQCENTKQWSGAVPKCRLKQCATLTALAHCEYFGPDNKCGSSKQLKCEECYYNEECKILNENKHKESMTTTCNNDKEWHWNVKEPVIKIKQCPEPPQISNGVVVLDSAGTDCGGQAKYTCDKCFQFQHKGNCLCETRKCIADNNDCTKGMWNETAPVCERITCPVLSLPSHLELLGEDRSCGGHGIKTQCEDGYYLVDGDLTRECTESGTWTGKMPECKIKTCTPAFEHPEHGQVSSSSNTYGTIVKFSCDDCYELPQEFTDTDFYDNEQYATHRHYILECQATGNWNGSAPACRKKDCGNPGVYPNIKLLGADFSCTSEVKYQCNVGYERSAGSLIRTCTLNYDGSVSWKGDQPECSPVDCGEVAVADPVIVDYQDPDDKTTYLYKLDYTCGKWPDEACYEQPSPNEGQCLATGDWSLQPPTDCSRITCPSLQGQVDHGTLRPVYKNKPDNDCKQVVQWSCDPGYILTHTKSSRCNGGKWSTEVPSCDRAACYAQEAPENGVVTPSYDSQTESGLHYLNDDVSYSCDTCYSLEGPRVRRCVASGDIVEFNGTTPTCKLKTCRTLNFDRAVGSKSTSRTDCGRTVTFSCKDGYHLEGSSTTICKDEGSADGPDWTNVEPTCEDNECPSEGIDFDNAEIFKGWMPGKKGRYVGYTTVTYRCMEGYEQIGEETITCGTSGKWDYTPPTCQQIPCDKLTPPVNGGFVIETSKQVVVECNSCYSAVDEARTSLHCINGTWNKVMTECRQTFCGFPGSPADGNIKGGIKSNAADYYKCGMEVEYQCDPDKTLNGDHKRTCTESSKWTGSLPTCLVNSCPALPDVPHSKPGYSSNTAVKVNYVCDHGYVGHGSLSRKCYSGQWSGVTPYCTIHTCGKWGEMQFGKIESIKMGLDGGERTFGAQIKYSCKEGDRYQLVEDDVRSCTMQGWSGKLPYCRCTTCPELDIVNGFLVSQNERRIDSSIQYVCDSGFTLSGGNAKRTCQKNGEWDGTEPTCIRVTCPRPAQPEGGRIVTPNPDKKHPGQQVIIECDNDAKEVVLTCKDDASWDGSPVNCNCHYESKQVDTTVITVTPGMCVFGHCFPEIEETKVVKKTVQVEVCDLT